MKKKTTEKPRVRVTVSMDPDVLEIFQQIANLGKMSLSRCIGEWCADTAEGAQFVVQQMFQAKAAPARVMRQLNELNEASKPALLLADAIRKGGGLHGRK